METFQHIKENNPDLKIYHIEDRQFSKYGRVLTEGAFSHIIDKMDEYPIPERENVYKASVSELEFTSNRGNYERVFFGGSPVQIGYCNGNTHKLNALEYHKTSEINVAVTDFILLLADKEDLIENTIDSSKVEAFYVPKGVNLEIYPYTLHFAPCKVQPEGFKCIVILPKGTNEPIETHEHTFDDSESDLLFMENKWLIAHPERKTLIEKGAFPGIRGENIQIKL
ncbi:DUF4867 domain-containing protein [Salipaludibacillus keqinensis]|uniref:DUF4867 domain-containing protein n=1 Tax=Salipaludibacillus keqinensis TaxID=2045207 RepID=A0A323TGD3_9BACI|nr:DUF4867 family protein [Salipaludibacillus keqinensis]PYZ92617.1 DUF4867 domain-containing protein [Salipaludibacillus keqinensis]